MLVSPMGKCLNPLLTSFYHDCIYLCMQSARSLASHLSREHLGANQLLEIYWPAQKCALLEADVVLLDR